MSPNDKRQRQRESRSAAQRARAQALQRRRRGRLLGLLLAAGALLALGALAARGNGPAHQHQGGDQPATPSVACGASAPPGAHPKQYDRAPSPGKILQHGVDYGAVIHTSCGDIRMDLLETRAPKTVASFVFLAGQGFYDGLEWTRIENDFVIQTGDPDNQNGHPPDGAGYSLPDEVAGTQPNDYVYGTVGLANQGPGTGSSQFFVVVHKGNKGDLHTPAGLSPIYTIFGKVEPRSYSTVERIASRATREGASDPVKAVEPIHPLYIESIDITRS